MISRAEIAWQKFCKPSIPATNASTHMLNLRGSAIPYSLSNHKKTIFAALLISTTALSGCVGSSVNNALDVAVISSTEDPVSLDGQSDESSTQLAASDLAGSVPIPVRSPLVAQPVPSNETALLPTTDESPVAQAAADVLNENIDASSAVVPTPQAASETQLASLDTSSSAENLNTNPPVATDVTADSQTAPTPAVSQTVTQVPKQTEKPKTLFELWFGKKTKQATKGPVKAVKPATKTVIASAVPSTSSINGSTSGLPGVQRNSALFGINDEEADDEDDSVQVASVGSLGRIMSPKGLVLQTERVQVDCFKPELMRILTVVERRYGKKVMVTSGYRSPTGNRRAGGARNSTHIYCKAADIQIEGVSKWDLAKFLRTVPGRGGVGTYCRTESVHIDVGSQRDWHHPCRRSKKKRA
jgi:uncharacterized protein YcbK (DUF882 family)